MVVGSTPTCPGMIKKIPSKHEPKKSPSIHDLTPLRLNQKHVFVVRPIAPTCELPTSKEHRWRKPTYVVFVIHDSQVKYLEFGKGMYESFKTRGSDTVPSEYDPGDTIHGGEWKIFYSKPHREYRAEFLGESRLTKHHRKLVQAFLRDNPNPFEIFREGEMDSCGYGGCVRRMFTYTEKVIPV